MINLWAVFYIAIGGAWLALAGVRLVSQAQREVYTFYSALLGVLFILGGVAMIFDKMTLMGTTWISIGIVFAFYAWDEYHDGESVMVSVWCSIVFLTIGFYNLL